MSHLLSHVYSLLQLSFPINILQRQSGQFQQTDNVNKILINFSLYNFIMFNFFKYSLQEIY